MNHKTFMEEKLREQERRRELITGLFRRSSLEPVMMVSQQEFEEYEAYVKPLRRYLNPADLTLQLHFRNVPVVYRWEDYVHWMLKTTF